MKIIKIACCNDCPYLKRCSPESQTEILHQYKVKWAAQLVYPIFNCETGELNCDPMEFGATEMIGIRVPYYNQAGKYVGCRMGNCYVDNIYYKRYYNPKLGVYIHRYCELNWDFIANGIFNFETNIWLKLFNDMDTYIISSKMDAQVKWASSQLYYVDKAIFYKFYHYNEIITRLV